MPTSAVLTSALPGSAGWDQMPWVTDLRAHGLSWVWREKSSPWLSRARWQRFFPDFPAVDRPARLWVFCLPDPPVAWLALRRFLTHTAASTGLPSGLGMLPPQPSQGPCLSLPNAESFLTALLQFLAQGKSLS